MLAVLRINNIIGDRAAPELNAKLGGSFQEVGRNLSKRAVIFYELYAVSPQIYRAGTKKQVRTLEVYVNAAEAKAFYVVNGKSADENGNAYSIDL